MTSNRDNLLPAVVERPIQYVEQTLPSFAYSRPGEADGESIVPLSHYLWILRLHRWKILIFIGACVLATVIVSSRLVPLYEATATIDIDRQTPPGIIGEEAARSSLSDADQFLATQVKLIQSDSVLRPVALRYKLLNDVDAQTGSDSAKLAARQDAPIVLKSLKVVRPPNTYLLLVNYRSADPHLAADVANAITQSYIMHAFDLRFRASSSLATFMEKQIEELHAKMERSTGALVVFEKELNVINPEEKTSILSSRLLQLNTEYTNAQADRVRKEAESLSVGDNSMEAALASAQGESLRKLQEHLNEVQEKFAQVGGQYGANHPEYRKAAAQVAEVQRLLEKTRENIAGRVNVGHREAVSREEMLKAAVAETKSEFDKLNARSFEYQQLKREAEGDKKLYEELVRRIKEAGINASFQNSSIRLADPARPPVKTVFPDITLNTLLALVFSSLLSIGGAVLHDVLDNTVRSAEDVSRVLNLAMLGTLPAVKNWSKRLSAVITNGNKLGSGPIVAGAHEEQAIAAYTEAMRTLRNNILLADFDRRLRTIMVTSPSPAEGKSTIAAHLAIAHAEQGKKTLLIDGDLRRPSVHRKFGFSPSAGLSSVLLEEVKWPQVLFKPEGLPTLDILPAGPASHRASEMIGPGMVDLLDEISQEYDLVILDAPPLLGFAEALQMSTSVDGVLVVARAGETNRKAITSLVATLNRLRVSVLGLVLNEVKRDTSDSYYYYGHYGKYYQAEGSQEDLQAIQ
jgi:succinoglycan biosynthesis transport protein ExoP